MVGRHALNVETGVRIPVPQQKNEGFFVLRPVEERRRRNTEQSTANVQAEVLFVPSEYARCSYEGFFVLRPPGRSALCTERS